MLVKVSRAAARQKAPNLVQHYDGGPYNHILHKETQTQKEWQKLSMFGNQPWRLAPIYNCPFALFLGWLRTGSLQQVYLSANIPKGDRHIGVIGLYFFANMWEISELKDRCATIFANLLNYGGERPNINHFPQLYTCGDGMLKRRLLEIIVCGILEGDSVMLGGKVSNKNLAGIMKESPTLCRDAISLIRWVWKIGRERYAPLWLGKPCCLQDHEHTFLGENVCPWEGMDEYIPEPIKREPMVDDSQIVTNQDQFNLNFFGGNASLADISGLGAWNGDYESAAVFGSFPNDTDPLGPFAAAPHCKY